MSLSVQLLEFAISTINSIGYAGVGIILLIVNVGIPIPSEAVLILAGAAAHTGTLQLWLVVALGIVMQTIGCAIAFSIGHYGGVPFIKRYGKYLLISEEDYKKTQHWFAKHGSRAIFVSLLTPVVRAFIGIVAGTNRVGFKKFILQCLLGSTIWTVMWVGVGWLLGNSWRAYYGYMHYVDYAVVLILAVFMARFLWKKMHATRTPLRRGKGS